MLCHLLRATRCHQCLPCVRRPLHCPFDGLLWNEIGGVFCSSDDGYDWRVFFWFSGVFNETNTHVCTVDVFPLPCWFRQWGNWGMEHPPVVYFLVVFSYFLEKDIWMFHCQLSLPNTTYSLKILQYWSSCWPIHDRFKAHSWLWHQKIQHPHRWGTLTKRVTILARRIHENILSKQKYISSNLYPFPVHDLTSPSIQGTKVFLKFQMYPSFVAKIGRLPAGTQVDVLEIKFPGSTFLSGNHVKWVFYWRCRNLSNIDDLHSSFNHLWDDRPVGTCSCISDRNHHFWV